MNKVSECGKKEEVNAKPERLEKGAFYFGYDEYYIAVGVSGSGKLLYSLRTGNIWNWDAEKYVPEDFKKVPKGTCIQIITE